MYLGSYIKPYTHVHIICWWQYYSLQNLMMAQVVLSGIITVLTAVEHVSNRFG
jgi:hypothetical protein